MESFRVLPNFGRGNPGKDLFDSAVREMLQRSFLVTKSMVLVDYLSVSTGADDHKDGQA